ncbi:hypothetical protein N7540_004737 [Penicillium herquei]|nr:hypothetical protein N7540_004737 [Penicillium herquei]
MLPRNAVKRLNLAGEPNWRRDKALLFRRAEASCDSEIFKCDDNKNKALAKRWDGLFSEEARKREPSSIKAIARAAAKPGMISLGAGAPSPDYFPFEAIHVNVKSLQGLSIDAGNCQSELRMAKYDFEPGLSEYSLDVALSYGQGAGVVQMLRFVTEHTELLHDPPYRDWGCCMTVGNTSALDSTLRMFCEKGDCIIVDEYTFSTALETASTLGIKTLPIPMDKEGLIREALDQNLLNWDESDVGSRKPFLLYMIPTGHNPTGATQSLKRREAIYAVAQKHALYIVEDEPYYYLQLPALDTDGRVLRMDSLSKILAPGSRTGWVTASQQVIEKFIRQNETSSQHPSGFSQAIIFNLLNHHWGHLGFFEWLDKVRLEYTWRRDTFVQACLEFLPAKIAKIEPTEAGMFQWIKIDWKLHPLYKTSAEHQIIQQAIFDSAVRKNVFLIPGTCFWASKQEQESEMFFRATFASASKENLIEAARRFGEALKYEFE